MLVKFAFGMGGDDQIFVEKESLSGDPMLTAVCKYDKDGNIKAISDWSRTTVQMDNSTMLELAKHLLSLVDPTDNRGSH